MVIGGSQVGGVISGDFNGLTTNFQVYRWAEDVDYNVLPMILQGMPDRVSHGVTVENFYHSDRRLGNNCRIVGRDGGYTNTMVFLDEGTYGVYFTAHLTSGSGQVSLSIDGIEHGRFDLSTIGGDISNVNLFLRDVKLGKGMHLVRLEIHSDDQEEKEINFSQLKFNKKLGSDDGGAGSFIVLGDVLESRSKLLGLFGASANHFTSKLRYPSAYTPEDGTFAEGVLYLAGGSWKITYHQSQLNDAGIGKILFNDQVIIDADGFGANALDDVVTTNVVLPQGRNVVRFEVNGKDDRSSGFRPTFHGIRGELQGNSCDSDVVQVTAADDDLEKVAGIPNDHVQLLNNHVVFTTEYQMFTDDAVSARKRFFSGGVYLVDYHVRRFPDGGAQKLSVTNEEGTQEVVVFDRIDYDSGEDPIDNVVVRKYVEIPRGYWYVTMSNLGGGGSSGSSNFSWLRFRCMGKSVVHTRALTINSSDSRVLLADYRFRQDSFGMTIPLSGVDWKTYDQVIVDLNGRSTDILSVGLRVNGISANKYKKVGSRVIEGEHHVVDEIGDRLNIVGAGAVNTVDQTFHACTVINFGKHSTQGQRLALGEGYTSSNHAAREDYSWIISGEDVREIKSLQLLVFTNRLMGKSSVNVYGIRRLN